MYNELSLPMGELLFLLRMFYIYSSQCSIRLQIAILARSIKHYGRGGDPSQTIPVQIMHAFMSCCFTQIEHMQF